MATKKYDKKTVGLERGTFKRNRQWAVDNVHPKDGYIKDLRERAKSDNAAIAAEAEEALAFLAKFNNEYYNNTGLKKEDAFHNTPELRKECYDRTNAANRDLHAISGCTGYLQTDVEDLDGELTPSYELNMTEEDAQRQVDAQDDLLDWKLEQEAKAKKKLKKKKKK